MKALFKITLATALIVSLGFTYVSVKKSQTVVDEPVEEIIDSKAVEMGDDNLRGDTYKLVRERLITPYTEKTTKEPAQKMFSRCPSGNRASIEELAKQTTEYTYGVIRYYKGCEINKVVCNFRARLSDNSVDVLQSDSVTYIAADLWINKSTATK